MMQENKAQGSLPPGFLSFREEGFSDPDDDGRPNRMCVCLSDIHCTDGTVGNQSSEAVLWADVFNRIKEACVLHEVAELYLILNGDVVDMIRSAQWTQNNVYPWEKSKPEFAPTLRNIMQGIINLHAKSPIGGEPGGFFYYLKQLYTTLPECHCRGKESRVINIQTIVLLGNHDKEILADNVTLNLFYTECLGKTVYPMRADYCRWVGEMYFADENRFLNNDNKPWLPFYWGDRGFRLFVTHGQWRDTSNCWQNKSDSIVGHSGWQVSDGWCPQRWQSLNYSPFTESCFGDTVAAGLLSGFIFHAKNKLPLPGNTQAETQVLHRLRRILDELDLYRPTYSAISRIIEETRRLRSMKSAEQKAMDIVEDALWQSLYQWLCWDFTLKSARPCVRTGLRALKLLMHISQRQDVRIKRGILHFLMWLFKRSSGCVDDDNEIYRFPGFLKAYREYGFRIHCEGHTHISLQEELYFPGGEVVTDGKVYSYINTGAWRDQIVTALTQKYRRRGIGRALYVLDLLPGNNFDVGVKHNERRFSYWVEDTLSWSDEMDKI